MVTMNNISVDDEVHTRMRELAQQRGCTVEEIAADLLAGLADDEHELTPEQQAAVDEGMEQLDRGETVTEEELMAELKALRR